MAKVTKRAAKKAVKKAAKKAVKKAIRKASPAEIQEGRWFVGRTVTAMMKCSDEKTPAPQPAKPQPTPRPTPTPVRDKREDGGWGGPLKK
jgi:hypothetical protein